MQFSIASCEMFRVRRAVFSALTFAIAVIAMSCPLSAQERGFDDEGDVPLKVGDKVELRSGQSGVVVSVDGAKVKILLTVPAVDLVIPGQPRRPALRRPDPRDPRDDPRPFVPNRPDTPRQGFDGPDRPQAGGAGGEQQTLPYVGTWLSTDRAVVIKNGTESRVFWTDENKVTHVSDGKYTLEGDLKSGETFYFSSGQKTWPWKLTDLNETKMTLAHAEVGTRIFQRVKPNFKHPLAGTYDVQYTTDRGRRGTSKFYLYQDGMYVIDEYSQTGKLDHREYGSWTADFQKGSLSITFPYDNKLNTSNGTFRDTGPTSMVFTFKSLGGETYTYNCQKKVTRQFGSQGSGQFGRGSGGGGQGGFGNP